MLGKLAIWLRISGYDTLYIGDFNFEDEDQALLENFKDRILLTKDKTLYQKALKNNRAAIYIKSNDVAEQMRELKNLGVNFQIVMDRCSVCNTPLRKPNDDEVLEVMKKEGIERDLREIYELWFCEKCKKLYWMGSHWKNMVRFLMKVEKD